MWGKLLFGALCGASAAAMPSAWCYRSVEQPKKILFEKRKNDASFATFFQPYMLGQIIPITHDVALFRFLLQEDDDEFNLKPCSTLQGCYKYGVQPTDQCYRFYTPVTANHTKGYFDIIVKRKPGGAMTEHMFGLHVGDQMLWRAVPFKIQYRPNRWKEVGMIAGGTGFTPMLQVIRHALTEDFGKGGDRTKLSFLYCNRSEKHILLKGLFDDLAARFPDRFKMAYTIDKSIEKGWKHYTGYVTPEMVRKTMPDPNCDDSVLLLCGPDHLLHHVAGTPMGHMSAMSGSLRIQPMAPDLNNLTSLGGVLGQCGYKNENVYRF